MTTSLSDIALPTMSVYLSNLSDITVKGERHALEHRIEPATLLAARLFPDMHPFSAQVQFACDFAKGAVTRLAGRSVPSFPDNEGTFEELRSRISKTLILVSEADSQLINASAGRDIGLTFGGQPLAFAAEDYLLQFALPSMIFHVSIAYAILRSRGVNLGKADFLGTVLSGAGAT